MDSAEKLIARYAMQYRRAACLDLVEPKAKEACTWTWGLIVQRRITERAALELWLKALQLDPKDIKERTLIYEVLIPSAKYKAMSDETNQMEENAKVIFPAIKKSP
jgi:hypothetical protein